jgi:hypothetical protein
LFRQYLVSAGDERVLLGYHEAVELQERLGELDTITDKDVKLDIFLHLVGDFYDTFVGLGAPQRLVIPEGTRGDLMRRFANSEGIEHEVIEIFLMMMMMMMMMMQ